MNKEQPAKEERGPGNCGSRAELCGMKRSWEGPGGAACGHFWGSFHTSAGAQGARQGAEEEGAARAAGT